MMCTGTTLYDQVLFVAEERIKRSRSQVEVIIANRLNEFVELIQWSGVSGVYLIDDHYIGKTKNIGQRMAQHISEAFCNERKVNPAKSERIRQRLVTGPLQVHQLSTVQEDEVELIKAYRASGHTLTNIEVPITSGPVPDFLFWGGFLPCVGTIERDKPFHHIARHSVHQQLYASDKWIYDTQADKFIRPDSLTTYLDSL